MLDDDETHEDEVSTKLAFARGLSKEGDEHIVAVAQNAQAPGGGHALGVGAQAAQRCAAGRRAHVTGRGSGSTRIDFSQRMAAPAPSPTRRSVLRPRKVRAFGGGLTFGERRTANIA